MPYHGPGGRMPPGPPPGRPPMLPPGPPPGLPPRMHVRLPPGPPPGIPSRMIRYNTSMHHPPPTASLAATITPNIVSAEPQLINREEPHQTGSTIEAKPKMRYVYIFFVTIVLRNSIFVYTNSTIFNCLRNLAADVTRFLPTSIRVKKDDGKTSRRDNIWNQQKTSEFKTNTAASSQQGGQPTKDDAYMQFMQEMEGLL